jgi:FAD/FMN-containing dehydrogenase
MDLESLVASYAARLAASPLPPLCYGFLDAGCGSGYYVTYEYTSEANGSLRRDEMAPALFNVFVEAQRASPWVRANDFPLMWATSAKPETTLRSRRLLLWNKPPAAFEGLLLQKYFVPVDRFARFARAAGAILAKFSLTVVTNHFRYVPGNSEAVLSFSPQPTICMIPCYLAKKQSPAWQASLGRATAELVDAALELGGSYYLTFDMSSSKEQFHRAYPNWRRFVDLKTKVDPEGLFTSQFYERLLAT